jgi:hypothetical protein
MRRRGVPSLARRAGPRFRTSGAVLVAGGLVAIGLGGAAVLGVFSGRGLTPTPMTLWRRAPWNDDARSARVDPRSASLIASCLARGNFLDPKVPLADGYAFAWARGTARDLHYAVRITRYRYPLDSSIPIPRGTEPPPGGDAHLTIYAADTGAYTTSGSRPTTGRTTRGA